jgi:hypothetical protein
MAVMVRRTTKQMPSDSDTASPAVPPLELIQLLRPPGQATAKHYERRMPAGVQAGELLARVSDPKSIDSALGSGVRLSDDRQSVLADADGRLVLHDGKVCVEKATVIAGDVDSAAGNLDIAEHIIIGGSVSDKAKVRGGGDIDIDGLIAAAEVTATADLHVAGGISGKDKAVVRCGGRLSGRHIANAQVECGGPIATGMIANSRVVCGGALDVGRGAIVAGQVVATGGITCGSIGSPAAVRTVVEAGADENLRRQCAEALPKIARQRRKAQKIRATVEPLMGDQKHLTAEQKQRVDELLAQATALETENQAATDTLRSAYEAMAARAQVGIQISKALYPGVEVRFPGLSATIDGAIAGPVRVTARLISGESRIVLIYGPRGAAHPLNTVLLHDDPLAALKRLLTAADKAAAKAAAEQAQAGKAAA